METDLEKYEIEEMKLIDDIENDKLSYLEAADRYNHLLMLIPHNIEVNSVRLIKSMREKFPKEYNIYRKFIIPVGNSNREDAEKQIYEIMNEYKSDIKWNDKDGNIDINGSGESSDQTNMPFSEDFWFPVRSDNNTIGGI